MFLPWELLVVVVVVVTGDLPLVWAGWVDAAGAVVVGAAGGGGGAGEALVMTTRRPSGLVPYCTGWNNLAIRSQNQTRFPPGMSHHQAEGLFVFCVVAVQTSWV